MNLMVLVHLFTVGHIRMTYLFVKRSIMLFVIFVNYLFNLFCYIICQLNFTLKNSTSLISSEPDKQGHNYGPNSPEVRDAVSRV